MSGAGLSLETAMRRTCESYKKVCMGEMGRTDVSPIAHALDALLDVCEVLCEMGGALGIDAHFFAILLGHAAFSAYLHLFLRGPICLDQVPTST